MALPGSVVRGGLVLAGALLFAIAPANAAQSGCANADSEPTGHNLGVLKKAVLCLLNEERAARGIKPLKEDKKLLKAAKRHSDDMVRRHYFDHTSPEGGTMRDRARAARYVPRKGSWRVAENIAWGAGTRGTPAKIVETWMNSKPHRRNVLDTTFKHAGVGVGDAAPDGGEGTTVTLVLGRR